MGPIDTSRIWRRLLVICGLSALAVAAPLLDLYGRNPEVFVANRTSPGEIVLLGLLVTLAVPLVALAVLLIAEAAGPKAADVAYMSVVGLLGVATGLVVSRQVLPDNTIGAVLLAAGLAAAVVLLVRKIETVFVFASIAAAVVLILFLASSPTARLVWTGPEIVSEGGHIDDPSSIVLIQLDELPIASLMDESGTINSALFPNFARLADEGTWYRNAHSDSIATTQSVPAILTGRLGEKGMSPSSVDHPDNLFTLLGPAYEMHVIEWVADMCPEDVCPDYAGRAPARFGSLLQDVGVVYGHLTLPAAARERLPGIDNSWKGFSGQKDTPEGTGIEVEGVPVPSAKKRAEWVDWIQRIINGIDSGGPPTLSYAHLKSPHVPWITNPSGTHYDRPEEYTEVEGVEGDGRWGSDPGPALLGFQRHLYQLGFLDTMLGKLFEKLDETGTWDETVVIVVADHGASFVPGEHRRWPFENNRDDLYRVPLFIKYPHQSAGETRDEPVYGIDILPTIVDVLAIETDWEFDGISLLDVAGTNRPHEPVYWCCSREGASTDISALLDQVQRNHTWVPSQDSWPGVSAVGPYADLVGQPVTSLEVDVSEALHWSLDPGSDLVAVDLDSGFLQTLLTGRVKLPEGTDSDDLLVVVNGRVAGVGFVYRDSSGGGAIRGLIAEGSVVDGFNEIDILVPGPGDHRWLSGSAGVLTLELAAEDGRVLKLRTEGSRRVKVDKVVPTESGWRVVGWAADVTRKQTPDVIYVFAGDKLLVSGPPSEDNPNVVRWFNSDDLLRSGFAFDIDSSQVADDIDQLTVVAEFGDYAVGDPATLTR